MLCRGNSGASGVTVAIVIVCAVILVLVVVVFAVGYGVFANAKSALHNDGSMIAFADGHVRFMRSSMMPADSALVYDKGQWLSGPSVEGSGCIAITP